MLKAKNTIKTFFWCLYLSWGASKFYTILRVSAEILNPFLAILIAYLGRNIINVLARQTNVVNVERYLVVLLVSIFLVGAIQTVTKKGSQYCQSMHEEILRRKISVVLMEHGFSADLEHFDNPEYHDKLQTATQDSQATIYVVWSAISCVSAVISFVSVFTILFQANPLYGVVITLTAIPTSILAAKYTKILYLLNLEQINGLRQMNYYQGLTIDKQYVQELRLFGAGEILKNRYLHIWKNLFLERKKITKRRAIITALLELLPAVAIVLIGIHIALQVVAGETTVGDYSFFTGLIMQLLGSIVLLSSSLVNIYDNKMQMDNYKTIENFKNNVSETGSKILQAVKTIDFENVSFCYPLTDLLVLNNVTFSIRKEEKIAIVGFNGSGKSTLIKLLLRLYNPTSGKIKINGVDIQEYTLLSLRANFSVYFQDMFNYSFSLRENFVISDIGHVRTDVDNDIKDALLNAHCLDIIKRVSDNFSVELTRLFNKDGVELSGGQHQKLALARALYRNHSALVLDEPSSNLDPEAENKIFESLKEITKGKMTIFISHRLTNVFLADRIIVMEKGQVIEIGTQKELLKNPYRYAELFRYQQEKFTEVDMI